MFGVGGGFLLTPLLIFYGIPPGVAVATTASHITASAMSGAIDAMAPPRRRSEDGLRDDRRRPRRHGARRLSVRLDAPHGPDRSSSVSLGYVILLGAVGGLMLNESGAHVARGPRGQRHVPPQTPDQHNWIHGLPLKMRFRESRLYISIIPPVVLGLVVGMMSAIMGVGGGFMMVPAMIYLLRMPTNVVHRHLAVPDSVRHRGDDGTACGQQFLRRYRAGGVLDPGRRDRRAIRRAGRRQSCAAKQLRLLLALLVLAVAVRLFFGLIATPADLYCVAVGKT